MVGGLIKGIGVFLLIILAPKYAFSGDIWVILNNSAFSTYAQDFFNESVASGGGLDDFDFFIGDYQFRLQFGSFSYYIGYPKVSFQHEEGGGGFEANFEKNVGVPLDWCGEDICFAWAGDHPDCYYRVGSDIWESGVCGLADVWIWSVGVYCEDPEGEDRTDILKGSFGFMMEVPQNDRIPPVRFTYSISTEPDINTQVEFNIPYPEIRTWWINSFRSDCADVEYIQGGISIKMNDGNWVDIMYNDIAWEISYRVAAFLRSELKKWVNARLTSAFNSFLTEGDVSTKLNSVEFLNGGILFSIKSKTSGVESEFVNFEEFPSSPSYPIEIRIFRDAFEELLSDMLSSLSYFSLPRYSLESIVPHIKFEREEEPANISGRLEDSPKINFGDPATLELKLDVTIDTDEEDILFSATMTLPFALDVMNDRMPYGRIVMALDGGFPSSLSVIGERDKKTEELELLTNYLVPQLLMRFVEPVIFPGVMRKWRVKKLETVFNENWMGLALDFMDRDVAVDTHDPSIWVTSAPPYIVSKKTVKLAVEPWDLIPGFGPQPEPVEISWKLDKSPWTLFEKTDTITLEGLPDGIHEISIRTRDKAGNIQTIPYTRTFVVDTLPPRIEVYHDSEVSSGDFSFKVEVYDIVWGSDVRVKWALDGKRAGTFRGSGTVSFSNLEEGKHKVIIRATDRVGNVSEPYMFTFFVDRTRPVLELIKVPPKLTSKTYVSVKARLKDNIFGRGAIVWRVDNGDWEEVAEGEEIVIGGLSEGEHSVDLIGRDVAGNESFPVHIKFRVDLHPPEVEWLYYPERITFSLPAVFKLRVEDDISTIDRMSLKWSIDGVFYYGNLSIEGGIVKIEVDKLTDGRHGFTFFAFDEAGNRSEPKSWEFHLDTTALRAGGGRKGGCSMVGNTSSILPIIIFIFALRRRVLQE